MHDKPHPKQGETINLLVNADPMNFEVADWLDRVEECRNMVFGYLIDGQTRRPQIFYDFQLQVHHEPD